MSLRAAILLFGLFLSFGAQAAKTWIYPPCFDGEDRDCYQILGVEPDWTYDEIHVEFRKRAKLFHPDQNPGNTDAAVEFKAINEAWQTLKDEGKRETYDLRATEKTSASTIINDESDPRAKAILFLIQNSRNSTGGFSSRSLRAIVDAIPFHFQNKKKSIRAFVNKYKNNAEFGDTVVYAVSTYWLESGDEDGRLAFRNFKFELQLDVQELVRSNKPNAMVIAQWKTKLLKEMERAHRTVFPPPLLQRAAEFCYKITTGGR